MKKQFFEITLVWADGERRVYKACGINADDAKRKIKKEFATASVESCEYLHTYED